MTKIQKMPAKDLRWRVYALLSESLKLEHFCRVCQASFEHKDEEAIFEHYEDHRIDSLVMEAGKDREIVSPGKGMAVAEPARWSARKGKVTFSPNMVEKRVGYNDQQDGADADVDSPPSPAKSNLKKVTESAKGKRGRPKKLTLVEPAGVKKVARRGKWTDLTYKKSPTPSPGTPSPVLHIIKRLPADHPEARFRIRKASLMSTSSTPSPKPLKKGRKKTTSVATKKATKRTKAAEAPLLKPSTPSPPPVSTPKAPKKGKRAAKVVVEESAPPAPIPAPRGRKRKAPDDDAFRADKETFDSSSEPSSPVSR
jgi:hypothetical protein